MAAPRLYRCLSTTRCQAVQCMHKMTAVHARDERLVSCCCSPVQKAVPVHVHGLYKNQLKVIYSMVYILCKVL